MHLDPSRLSLDRKNKALLPLAATFILLFAAWYILFRFSNWYLSIISFIVTGLMQYRLVVACHEAVHKNLLFPIELNELSGLLLCSMVGINYARYREQHFQHHKAIVIKEDPDIYIYLPMLKTSPGISMIAVWIIGVPFEIIEKFKKKSIYIEKNTNIRYKELIHSTAILIVNLIIFYIFNMFGAWWSWIVFWLLPLLTIAIFLNRTRVWVEHGYMHAIKGVKSESLHNQKMETVDLVSNRLERFIIAPFAFNYHLSHHVKPSTPYYNNEVLSKILISQNKINDSMRLKITYIEAVKKMIFV